MSMVNSTMVAGEHILACDSLSMMFDFFTHLVESSGPINIVKGTHGQLILFLALNMWTSHLGLPLLLLVILLKKIQRHATFINLLVSFMVVGL